MGKTDVEDRLQRLDSLTKEETLMAVTRNLEVTHHVDGNVMAVKGIAHNIDGNVEETKALTQNIDDNVRVTKALTEDVGDDVKAIQAVVCSVDDNVKATKDGTRCVLFVFV